MIACSMARKASSRPLILRGKPRYLRISEVPAWPPGGQGLQQQRAQPFAGGVGGRGRAGQHQRDRPGALPERLQRGSRASGGDDLVVGAERPRQGRLEFDSGAGGVGGHRQHGLGRSRHDRASGNCCCVLGCCAC
jgi:hypothetical protein